MRYLQSVFYKTVFSRKHSFSDIEAFQRVSKALRANLPQSKESLHIVQNHFRILQQIIDSDFKNMEFHIAVVPSLDFSKEQVIDKNTEVLAQAFAENDFSYKQYSSKKKGLSVLSLKGKDTYFDLVIPGTYLYIESAPFEKILLTQVLPNKENPLRSRVLANRLANLVRNPTYDVIDLYASQDQEWKKYIEPLASQEVARISSDSQLLESRVSNNTIFIDL